MALAHALILGLGGLLIGIPILLHMLMQPKPKAYQFPALRFVKEMHQTNQRSLNLRHWVLLLLRCLLLLALAAAFAKPSTVSSAFGNWLGVGAGLVLSLLVGGLFLYALLWSKPANIPLAVVVGLVLALLLAYTGYTFQAATSKDTSHILADQQAPVASLILVDNSPRFSYVRENRTLLEKVQDHGRWLIGQLPLNSKVAVMETDDEFPFFSVDISAARKRLNTLDINYATSPLPETMERAIKFLADTEFERKEIYVFTDMTRVSWNSSGDSLKRLLERNPDVSVFVIDVGVEDPSNFALGELKMSASSIPMKGKLELETQVRSNGPGSDLLLRMFLEKPDESRPVRRDGETLVPEQHWTRVANVAVEDDSVVSAKIILQDELAEGVHHGWLEIEGSDSLSADDKRHFTIEVRPSWPALVVHPENVKPGNVQDILEIADGMFQAKAIPQSQLAGEPLQDYSLIMLLNPKPISPQMWGILESYVEAGGGLAVFLGHNALTLRKPDEAFRTEAAARVLPGILAIDWLKKKSGVLMTFDNLTHPILKRFRTQDTRGIWQPFPVYRHWEIQTDPSDANVQVIARYSNGVGAIFQRTIGGGRVICMTTPVTEPVSPRDRKSWNDLFNFGSGYSPWPGVMLVTEIASFLASSNRDRINLGVGQSMTMFNDINLMPADYRLFTPRNEEPIRVTSAEGLLRYKFTDTPGAYRLKGQFNDQSILRGFSVNMPADSTDLNRVDEATLTGILGEERFRLAREREEIERQQGTTRLGQEFYPVLALCMCLLLALELIMSNRFYKKVE